MPKFKKLAPSLRNRIKKKRFSQVADFALTRVNNLSVMFRPVSPLSLTHAKVLHNRCAQKYLVHSNFKKQQRIFFAHSNLKKRCNLFRPRHLAMLLFFSSVRTCRKTLLVYTAAINITAIFDKNNRHFVRSC